MSQLLGSIFRQPQASFEDYYQGVLSNDAAVAPRVDEARRDYRAALQVSLRGLL